MAILPLIGVAKTAYNAYKSAPQHVGAWGTKDFGVTEAIQKAFVPQKAYAMSGGSDLFGSASDQSPTNNINTTTTNIDQFGPKVNDSGWTSGGGGGGGLSTNTGSQLPDFRPTSPNDNVGGNSEMDIINNEYNSMMNYYSGQENASRQNFANFEGQMTRDRDMGLQTAAQEQGVRQKELDATAEGGRQQERLNLQKVRQMLADLDQRNAAQTAISGGGSMNEALADRYNRTAMQSQGEVVREGQNYQNKVALEVEKVNQFYDNKRKEIGNWFQTQIAQGRQDLNNRLGEIASARDASAQAKQRATMDAWRSYYSDVNQARIAAADFNARYSNWKTQMDNQLIPTLASYEVGNIPGQDISNAMGLFSNQPTVTQQPQTVSYAPTRIRTKTGINDEEEQDQGLFA